MNLFYAVVGLSLVASAIYRTVSGKHEPLTAGLWTAALAVGIAALASPIDTALGNVIGLANPSQLPFCVALVISSYLVARTIYYVARIDSRWPLIFTAASITGMVVLYCATDLHVTRTDTWIEASPGAGSAWFAVALAVGVFPTHIAAIIGVLKVRQPDNLMMWLLAVYGVIGALYPVLIVADHLGAEGVRWSPSAFYPLVWGILLASFGALTVAGSIGAHRAVSGRHAPVAVPAGL